MVRTSKEVFAEILNYAMEFESVGQEWCDKGSIGAAGKARSFSKKLMEELRTFVKLTIEEEVNMANVVATPVTTAPVVEVPKEVVKEPVVAPVAAPAPTVGVVETPKPATSSQSSSTKVTPKK